VEHWANALNQPALVAAAMLDQDVAVAAGEIVAIPAQRHGIRAETDSALLLTVPIT
jgi:quercetin dioxygenase-like cupin family protein